MSGSDPRRMVILGAGSWGTALAYLFASRVGDVVLVGRNPSATADVQRSRRNARYLPGVTLPPNVSVTSDLEPVRRSDLVILAVPSFALAETCHSILPLIRSDALVLNAAKGLESETGRRLSEVVLSILPVEGRLAVLSGPNLAGEAAGGVPTATVIASSNHELSATLQALLSVPTFRIYTNPDVPGVELGGALKNIIAIAAGIVDGIGCGENTKAALVCRGLTEIRRLGRSLGALDETFSGLSGIGDLYATCASSQSRNHRVGFELGRGRTLAEILAAMDQTAEGVPTTQAALCLSRRTSVRMPITESLGEVLFAGASPSRSIEELMNRAPAAESGPSAA